MTQFISRTQFETALTDASLRITLVIQLALTILPVMFLLMVVAFFVRETPDPTMDLDILNFMTVLHFAFLFTAIAGGRILFQRIFSRERIATDPSLPTEEVARRGMGTLRTAIIVRIALLEGAAMLGNMICLIAAMNGILSFEPLYWCNAASTVALLVIGATTMPTRERVLGWFEERFQAP